MDIEIKKNTHKTISDYWQLNISIKLVITILLDLLSSEQGFKSKPMTKVPILSRSVRFHYSKRFQYLFSYVAKVKITEQKYFTKTVMLMNTTITLDSSSNHINQ